MLVYDGDCAFCTRCADRGRRHLPASADVVAWQRIGDLGVVGLTERDVRTAAYWIAPDGRQHRGHLAVAAALVACGGVWALAGRILRTPPVDWLAGPVYRLVARHRHRMPGGSDACRVEPE